jgi:hypothetical protein
MLKQQPFQYACCAEHVLYVFKQCSTACAVHETRSNGSPWCTAHAALSTVQIQARAKRSKAAA